MKADSTRWESTRSADRKRPKITLTLDPATVEAIDAARGDESRSAWLEEAARRRLAKP